MHILKKGRGAFLEFLRNLTPQVLLLTLIVIWSRQFKFSEIDFSNSWNTIIFFLLVATFVLAVIANSINFMENGISSTEWLDDEIARIAQNTKSIRERFVILRRTVGARKLGIVLFELVVALLVMQIGLLAALTSGILSALRVMQ